jgi:radical SAM superfamily enzyme YgiQ (UPF0313 family)
MTTKPIVLVAFTEQDNLGVGYLGSVLHQHGFKVKILDFRLGPQTILKILKDLNPLVVGFSVIFQHFIDQFQELINYLRENHITCHFTAGGHYPSLRYEQLLTLIPELDSVVLFEGEITFLELVRLLAANQDWRSLIGLAYRQAGRVIANPLRPLENDLDNFPPPIRQPLLEYGFGKKFATIVAGRGCFYNCSFCSIREFYSQPPGPIKRVRRPEMVVREMELLLQEQDCSIFMFQDDDFPITYQKGGWLNTFLNRLDETGLAEKIQWKINCRTDEISEEAVRSMKSRGLFLVYLGIESGTDEGLRRMNKHIDRATNLKAAAILKHLDVGFDYGFMLFDPSSDFDSIRANLDFMDELGCDGSSPVTFCKMMPYAGTRVEKELIAAGRLFGKVGAEDYHFYDPRIDTLYELMVTAFEEWIGAHAGLLNLARWAHHYIILYRQYFTTNDHFEHLAKITQKTIAESNFGFTRITRQMLECCEQTPSRIFNHHTQELVSEVKSLHSNYIKTIEQVLEELQSLERHHKN